MTQENNWDDVTKNNIRQSERMQDIMVTYASLFIKLLSVICGGALVSIGAAIVNINTSVLKPDLNNKLLSSIQKALICGFQTFSYALLFVVAGLLSVVISRGAFSVSADEYRHSDKIKTRHEKYGFGLEILAWLFYLTAFGLVIKAFVELNSAFLAIVN